MYSLFSHPGLPSSSEIIQFIFSLLNTISFHSSSLIELHSRNAWFSLKDQNTLGFSLHQSAWVRLIFLFLQTIFQDLIFSNHWIETWALIEFPTHFSWSLHLGRSEILYKHGNQPCWTSMVTAKAHWHFALSFS